MSLTQMGHLSKFSDIPELREIVPNTLSNTIIYGYHSKWVMEISSGVILG